MRQLARPLPWAMRNQSFLDAMQPQDAAPGRRRVLTRLTAWSEIDHAVLIGVMSGKSAAKVSKITFGIAARFGGEGLKRSIQPERRHGLEEGLAGPSARGVHRG